MNYGGRVPRCIRLPPARFGKFRLLNRPTCSTFMRPGLTGPSESIPPQRHSNITPLRSASSRASVRNRASPQRFRVAGFTTSPAVVRPRGCDRSSRSRWSTNAGKIDAGCGCYRHLAAVCGDVCRSVVHRRFSSGARRRDDSSMSPPRLRTLLDEARTRTRPRAGRLLVDLHSGPTGAPHQSRLVARYPLRRYRTAHFIFRRKQVILATRRERARRAAVRNPLRNAYWSSTGDLSTPDASLRRRRRLWIPMGGCDGRRSIARVGSSVRHKDSILEGPTDTRSVGLDHAEMRPVLSKKTTRTAARSASVACVWPRSVRRSRRIADALRRTVAKTIATRSIHDRKSAA